MRTSNEMTIEPRILKKPRKSKDKAMKLIDQGVLDERRYRRLQKAEKRELEMKTVGEKFDDPSASSTTPQIASGRPQPVVPTRPRKEPVLLSDRELEPKAEAEYEHEHDVTYDLESRLPEITGTSSPNSIELDHIDEVSGNRKRREPSIPFECLICSEEIPIILQQAQEEGKGGLGGGLVLWACDQKDCGALFCIVCAYQYITLHDKSDPKCPACTRQWESMVLWRKRELMIHL
ncbi:uncharacterized protein IL334_001147 [Kwoniella shivajii]|uniref:RING-type domain-containing protein n=1 Tax=Kwoniella shivajii TaxID=564305 RepID=A0ABZ1CRA3_9TREE|nr:hypothetical protein IL334_001147 [Kwoniella shivajii]